MERETARDGRIKRWIARSPGPGRVAALGACLGVVLAPTIGVPATAWAGDPVGEPVIEVAPGIHLAAASELPEVAVESLPSRSERLALTPRIVGGNTTSIARWPWQVSIGYLPVNPSNAFRSHTCGGTLVAPTIVVTAAHCMTLGGQGFFPAEEFQVVTGRTRLSANGGREHALADYFWFVDDDGRPLWNRRTIAWDVAFLRLASSSTQRTIQIAGPGEELVWAPGRRAFVTGWGTTSAGTSYQIGGRVSDVLRQARIRMVSDSTCGSAYGAAFDSSVMVCAGISAGGVDACAGDSGGPLVAPIARGGYRLVGSTSFGDGCGLPRTPGVYARLADDPIRSALQEGIQAVSGYDVIGVNATPSNQFRFGPRSRKRGSAIVRLIVRVPGRGTVSLRPSGRVRSATVHPTRAGRVRLPIRPRSWVKRRLGRLGAARVRATVTYTPMGGSPRTKSTKARLIKRR